MQVNNNNVSGLNGSGVQGPDRARQAEQTGGAAARGGAAQRSDGDSVQLSTLSQELRAAGEDSPERLERIAQLQNDVKTGRYQADSLEIGRKLIDEALTTPKSGGIGG